MSWPEMRPLVAPLKALAAGEEAEFKSELCRRCWAIFVAQPDLWADDPIGLDFHRSLLAFEQDCAGQPDLYDLGGAYLAFRAIDEGRRSLTHG